MTGVLGGSIVSGNVVLTLEVMLMMMVVLVVLMRQIQHFMLYVLALKNST